MSGLGGSSPHQVEATTPDQAGGLRVMLPIIAIAWVVLRERPLLWEHDSTVVYSGIIELIRWWRNGPPPFEAGPFPPFQYLTGLLIVAVSSLGLPLSVFSFWAYCSSLSLAGLCWLMFRVARQHTNSRAVGWAAVVALLSGPLAAYASSTFNELPAALLIAAFTAAVTGLCRAGTCAILFFLAGLTKEFAAPLLALIWIGTLWSRRSELGRSQALAFTSALIIAVAATLAAHAGLNLIRYGVPWNTHYLSEGSIVHNLAWRFEYAVSLWLAPNGGILFFWPSLAILLLIASSCSLQILRPNRTVAEGSSTLILTAVILLLSLTIGLSGWYSPFGWQCWGPRLLLPWMPSIVILVLRGAPSKHWTRSLKVWLVRPEMFCLSATIVALLALPHVIALQQAQMVKAFFEGDDERFVTKPEPQDVFGQHEKIIYEAWRKRPILLSSLASLRDAETAVSSFVYIAALILLLWRVRIALLGNKIRDRTQQGHV